MTDIFISYARSTAAQAQIVAEALRRLGYGVWRDDELPAHRAYAEVIEERLRAARAVVVVWSAEAVKSQWVRAEANLAREAGTLVQLRIDDCTLPLPFNEIQCADLSGWTGNPDAPGWQRVLESVDHLCGKERSQPATVASSTPVAPAISLSSILKKPVVLGGLAAAGVAAVALLGVTLMRAPSAPAANQRIAFFGYTVDGNDPSGASTALAKSATDKMFQSLRAFRLDAAAPTETIDTPTEKRFAKAAAVGARYALSGEVRTEGAQSVLALRVEDVASHTTLWEKSFSGPLNDSVYLPAIPVWPANLALRCIVRYRSRLTRDDPSLFRLIADTCHQGAYVDTTDAGMSSSMVSRLRDLAKSDPNSAPIQAALAEFLLLWASASSAPERPPLIAEAEAAVARANRLDPNGKFPIYASILVSLARGETLADHDALLRDVIPKLQDGLAIDFSQANRYSFVVLWSVGRGRVAAERLAAAIANDPAQGLVNDYLGMIDAVLGRSSKARAEFEAGLASYPDSSVWTTWTLSAIFMGAGDAEELLKSPPFFIPRSTLECLRDIHKASVSTDPTVRRKGAQRAIACTDSGDIEPFYGVAIPAALGDLDRTFDRLAREPRLNAIGVQGIKISGLFWPTSRALRADPRFLPLVERLGLMDYWRATKTQPDVCETEDVPFYRELKKTVAARR